ncbi:MAG: DUF3096 domain-containing protein [Candidatus Aenigmarchaeota archaeon]|nr:DUF3096 domain-containing protein [Candidatus Aenigmarchaeota archaeon]
MAVISIVFGILVIIRPDVLGALVGVFLIITGVIALFHVRW